MIPVKSGTLIVTEADAQGTPSDARGVPIEWPHDHHGIVFR